MSSRSPRLYVEDIQQACREILDFTGELTSAEEFGKDRRTFLAVVHSLEVIGAPRNPLAQGCQLEKRDCARIFWAGS